MRSHHSYRAICRAPCALSAGPRQRALRVVTVRQSGWIKVTEPTVKSFTSVRFPGITNPEAGRQLCSTLLSTS